MGLNNLTPSAQNQRKISACGFVLNDNAVFVGLGGLSVLVNRNWFGSVGGLGFYHGYFEILFGYSCL